MSARSSTKAMGNLTLTTPSSNPQLSINAKPKKKAVADSWEDDSSDEEPMSASTLQSPAIVSTTSDRPGVSAPPPTPNSPANPPNAPWHGQAPVSSNMLHPYGNFPTDTGRRGSLGYAESTGAARRPEKTDAVARRMIASALGVKAPKATEEQKAYDRAVRDAERKKREEEREVERKRAEETERAKQAIWDD